MKTQVDNPVCRCPLGSWAPHCLATDGARTGTLLPLHPPRTVPTAAETSRRRAAGWPRREQQQAACEEEQLRAPNDAPQLRLVRRQQSRELRVGRLCDACEHLQVPGGRGRRAAAAAAAASAGGGIIPSILEPQRRGVGGRWGRGGTIQGRGPAAVLIPSVRPGILCSIPLVRSPKSLQRESLPYCRCCRHPQCSGCVPAHESDPGLRPAADAAAAAGGRATPSAARSRHASRPPPGGAA